MITIDFKHLSVSRIFPSEEFPVGISSPSLNSPYSTWHLPTSKIEKLELGISQLEKFCRHSNVLEMSNSWFLQRQYGAWESFLALYLRAKFLALGLNAKKLSPALYWRWRNQLRSFQLHFSLSKNFPSKKFQLEKFQFLI